MFETIILSLFSVIRDLVVSLMRLDITSDVSSNESSFVPTCNMYKSGLKSLLVGLVYSSIAIVFADEKGLTFTIKFLLMGPVRR